MSHRNNKRETENKLGSFDGPQATEIYTTSSSVVMISQEECDDMKDSYIRTDSLNEHTIDSGASLPWIKQKKAVDFFIGLLTCLYALILTIIALIIEVSPTWKNDIWLAETIFFVFMYGCGVLFFMYCYIFVIYPETYNFIARRLVRMKLLRNSHGRITEKTNYNGEGAGTLYLRLGALFFGSAGIVLFGLEMFLCVEDKNCRGSTIAKHIVAMLFTFIQMHFIFCNSKISIGVYKVTKFGMMHLVSVNLWTWFRFVLTKAVLIHISSLI
ncbi:hypothetical protein DICVIV_06808 [Dictyocaulus viviparus]|uniref:Uncharacterized protein n=1 Tax=Dictyocaulus viviparus TaxID=29172 RepID=A0A0D8XRF5_DICVI|nr:hypothetical protein DICVIV_06808 [Dictyocaulus viviparus]